LIGLPFVILPQAVAEFDYQILVQVAREFSFKFLLTLIIVQAVFA